MFVGAGTVITLEQCKKAVACGAKFIVAPGYSEEVDRLRNVRDHGGQLYLLRALQLPLTWLVK